MKLPRLYAILDTATLERRGCADWALVARAMLDGGAEMLQIRHKGAWTRAAFAQVERTAAACTEQGATLLVNDRADVAKMLGAGVHVGQDDLSPGDCRALLGDGLLGDALVGFSTHNMEQLAAAGLEPVDYLAVGPIFATQSKLNPDATVGLAGVSRARATTEKPLVAIGGITRQTARAALDAGADSVALIADLLPEVIDYSTTRSRMEEWQRLIRK